MAVLALAFWSWRLSPWLVVVAAIGAALWSWGARPRRERLGLTAATILWLTIGLALAAQFRLWQVAERWPQLEETIEARAAEALHEGLDGLVEQGEQAVEGVLAAVERGSSGAALFQELRGIQARSGVSSIACFGPDGTSEAWAGEHRGAVPLSVRLGGAAYVFHEGPLFSYVYFVRPLPDGGSVATSALLDASLALGEGARPFAERFAARHGVRPRFVQPDRTQGETVWDWAIDHPILSVSSPL